MADVRTDFTFAALLEEGDIFEAAGFSAPHVATLAQQGMEGDDVVAQYWQVTAIEKEVTDVVVTAQLLNTNGDVLNERTLTLNRAAAVELFSGDFTPLLN